MSYRNDYDAACARVAALEAENAKLVAENVRLRAPSSPATPPLAQRPRLPMTPIVLVLAGFFGFIALALAGFR